jgi:hypothetical protein
MPFNKMLKKYSIRAAALLAGIVGLVIVINLSWFDEPLRPELARLTFTQDVSMEGNAYALLLGITAARDRDPASVGKAIVERLRERYRKGERIALTSAELDQIRGGSEFDGTDAAWRSGLWPLDCNSRLMLDCATALLTVVGETPTVHPDLTLLLDRYETILNTPRFAEMEEGDAYTPIPAYSHAIALSRIRLAKSLLRDSTPDFLERASEDFEFWRRVLRDGNSLVAKMVGIAGMRNNMELLSWLLANRHLDTRETETLRRIAAPLTDQERDIGEVFLSELRLSMLSDKDLVVMLGDSSPSISLTLQENATLNEYFLTTVQSLQLRAAMNPEAFARARANEPVVYRLRRFPPPLYNLGGKLVLKRMATEYRFQDYITRVHDHVGRMELLLLQTEIEDQPETPIATVVRRSRHRNPYTGEPMQYDAEAGTLSFECLSNNETDICAVAL